MTITYADFDATWPELTDDVTVLPPSLDFKKINSAILRAQTWYIDTTTFYGAKTDQARLALAAHLFVMIRGKEAHGDDGVGPVASRTIESSSISYGSQTFNDVTHKILETTSYGRELIELNEMLSGCATGFTG